MKFNQEIWDIWNSGGPFIGTDSKAHSRVTVEVDWQLRTSSGPVGSYEKLPIRYFQCADPMPETEIPNIKSINIEQSIDTDCASCTISIYNQKMYTNTSSPVNGTEVGQPGYYTFARGKSPEAEARWSQTANEWEDILTPNALIRTYQGYGATDQTIAAALATGNITQTGTWLVDEIRITTDGMMELRCRDVGKLLVEQQLFPPLVPARSDIYPLRYCRYYYDVVHTERIPYGSVLGTQENRESLRRTVFETASSDVYFGGTNTAVLGHHPSDAFDFSLQTFWLSPGSDHGAGTDVAEYLQISCGEQIDAVQVRAYGGPYTVYVSVMENNTWVTGEQGGTIPYTGTRYTGANTAAIPYVLMFGVSENDGATVDLGRMFNAQRVRITIMDLWFSPWDDSGTVAVDRYRAALTEVSLGVFRLVPEKIINGGERSAAGDGYLLAGSDGGVFTYGDAIFYGSEGALPIAGPVVGIARDNTGLGYWLGAADGGVFSFGDAPFYGSAANITLNRPIIAIESNPVASGYWLFGADGGVFTFGSAGFYGSLPVTPTDIVGVAITPTGNGYWMVNTLGQIYTFGDAGYHGGVGGPLSQPVSGIAGTPSGNGYWLVAKDGGVFTFGDAGFWGSMAGSPLNDPMTDIIPTPTGNGYWLIAEDGGVFTFGDAIFHGSLPGTFDATYQKDGNYFDYVDIIKDLLLWSGWWLCDGGTDAVVYANLESTGTFSPECLPEGMFDKRPVVDGINQIKEAVGYIFFIDQEGRAHFESPNWWASGNFDENGVHQDFIPDIDETLQLTQYAVSFSDRSSRSEIIISTEYPTTDNISTITTTFVPPSADNLKGIVKQAMWTNELFNNATEQEVMAELIGLHILFQQRLGSVTCAANPCIGINDQVRIYERQTAETYIHYVRSVSTTHDLDAGTYTMTLTTHWLGDNQEWVIASDNLKALLQGQSGSPAVNVGTS